MENRRGPQEGCQGVAATALIGPRHEDAVEGPQRGDLRSGHFIQGFPRAREGALRRTYADGRVVGSPGGELSHKRLEWDISTVAL